MMPGSYENNEPDYAQYVDARDDLKNRVTIFEESLKSTKKGEGVFFCLNFKKKLCYTHTTKCIFLRDHAFLKHLKTVLKTLIKFCLMMSDVSQGKSVTSLSVKKVDLSQFYLGHPFHFFCLI
jgi:hypothetical protein